MSNKSPDPSNIDHPSEIERLVYSAKDWVVPNDQLRPQVMASIRDVHLRKLQYAKLRNFFIVSAGIWLLVLSVFLTLRENRQSLVAPSAHEVEERSHEYSTRYRHSRDWGMVETFSEIRQLDISH
jgi:hypothetical protein